MYTITYDFGKDKDVKEPFKGTADELEAYVAQMKAEGCTNIRTARIAA